MLLSLTVDASSCIIVLSTNKRKTKPNKTQCLCDTVRDGGAVCIQLWVYVSGEKRLLLLFCGCKRAWLISSTPPHAFSFALFAICFCSLCLSVAVILLAQSKLLPLVPSNTHTTRSSQISSRLLIERTYTRVAFLSSSIAMKI